MSEAATYAEYLQRVLDEVATAVRDLDDERLAWRPAPAEANDVSTIVTHLVASTRGHAVGLGCGVAVQRDRPSEFRAGPRPKTALLRAVEDLRGEIAAEFAKLTDDDLGEPIAPPATAWIGTDPLEGERRRAIVHAIRHASIHLGEIQLTRDLALAARGGTG